MKTEQLSEAEYHERYRNACGHFKASAQRLTLGIEPHDVASALLATAVELLQEHEPGEDVSSWLHHMAEGLISRPDKSNLH